MSDLKQVASQTMAEMASSPKTAGLLGGLGAYISAVGVNEVVAILSAILLTVSIYNQFNIARDRKKAACKDRRKGD